MPSRASTSSPSSESREALPNLTLTRRDFLRSTGVAVATLGLEIRVWKWSGCERSIGVI
jgi:hypothetical protein